MSTTQLETNQHDKYTSGTIAGKRQMVAKALAKAIRNIELPFEINVKAYQVKLDTLVNTDDYSNPKRGFNHTTHINGIQDRDAIWSEFEYLFHLLENGDLNDVAMQTVKIFYRLDNEVTDQKQYNKIRDNVAQLLDLYGWIEIMQELPKRNL